MAKVRRRVGVGSAGRVGGRMRAVPWILILVVIAVVQLVREQPFDAAVFGTAAVALVLDTTGVAPVRARRPALPLAVVLAGAAAVAAVLVVTPRHGVVAGVAVGVVGVVALPIAWLSPPRGAAGDAARRIRVRRAAVGWACVVVAMCLVELWSFLAGRTTVDAQRTHPAISDLLDPALDAPVGRVVFVIAWLALGALLLTRGRSRRDA